MGATSLGIAYPAITDDVRPWEHMQNLAEDVDALIVEDRAANLWQAYTPVLDATGTNPSNYTISGRYTQRGKTVTAAVKITFSGAPGGSGYYRVTLPVDAVDAELGAGSCVIYDASSITGSRSAAVWLAYADQVRISADGDVGSDSPVSLAADDQIRFSFTYEAD